MAMNCHSHPDMHLPTIRRRAHGLTLLEVMVVAGMIFSLVALALPSLQEWITRWRVQQAVDDLRSTMLLARTQALRRSGDVFVQKLPGSTPTCTQALAAASWDCGWVVFVDANRNRGWDAGEELQRFVPAAGLSVTRSSAAPTIAIDRWGMVGAGGSVGFTIAPSPGSRGMQAARDVCIAPGGRIQVAARAPGACSA